MGVQNFIRSMQTKEMLIKAQRDFKREAETELKLIRAQVEFLNYAVEARKKLGLTFNPNPHIPELLRITEDEKRIRLQETFTLSINGLNETIYNEVTENKRLHSKLRHPKRQGFIPNRKTKD